MPQILVIDDDPAIRALLSRSLNQQGYDVAVASNGEEGIECAQRLRPSLIVCDWIMPVMDGLEVCRRVKSNPLLSTTFFIILTSRGATEDRVVGLDTGADEFLSKPIELNELTARVRAGLRIWELNEALLASTRMLETEMSEAAGYVHSLLPKPTERNAVSIQAEFIPSRFLGGDCFDFYWLDGDRLLMYLLDVAGHGVGSALLSVSLLNVLRSRSLPNVDFSQPDEVLRGLNLAFQMDNEHHRYFTIWCGVYDAVKRELVYSSAGHPPAILLNGTTETHPKQLKTTGVPVGMFLETKYGSERVQVDRNSLLYVFSDGVYELEQADGSLWGFDAFVNLIGQERHTYPAPPKLEQLVRSLRQFNGKDGFADDVSLLQVYFG